MERHPNDLTTDEEIDAAFERAKAFDSFPRIVESEFHSDSKVEFLRLRLSDGQQLLIPRQMLGELKDATVEQAADLFIGPQGVERLVAAVRRRAVPAGFPGASVGQGVERGGGVMAVCWVIRIMPLSRGVVRLSAR